MQISYRRLVRKSVDAAISAVERNFRDFGAFDESNQTELCRRLCDEVDNLPLKQSISALASLGEMTSKLALPPYEGRTTFTLAFLDVYDESIRRKTPNEQSFEEVFEVVRSLARLKFDVLERLKGIFRFAEQCIDEIHPHRALDFLYLALHEGVIPASTMSICQPILHRVMQIPSVKDLDMASAKQIEIILRLDFPHQCSTFGKETMEFLTAVREATLPYEQPEDTIVSYQLRYFLQNHECTMKCHAIGPYVLPLADPVRRICFLHDNETRRDRHLDALGWRIFYVGESLWRDLPNREAKARYVRNLLKENNLLEGLTRNPGPFL